ncbi:hypothetical protein V8G54_000988 [Vigna mungo]|uniref:Uncharacterized protein n=1 Tax=Vigna mungo TaxID=3915 RepID=A0AAQ3SBD0_VIGMU
MLLLPFPTLKNPPVPINRQILHAMNRALLLQRALRILDLKFSIPIIILAIFVPVIILLSLPFSAAIIPATVLDSRNPIRSDPFGGHRAPLLGLLHLPAANCNRVHVPGFSLVRDF